MCIQRNTCWLSKAIIYQKVFYKLLQPTNYISFSTPTWEVKILHKKNLKVRTCTVLFTDWKSSLAYTEIQSGPSPQRMKTISRLLRWKFFFSTLSTFAHHSYTLIDLFAIVKHFKRFLQTCTRKLRSQTEHRKLGLCGFRLHHDIWKTS